MVTLKCVVKWKWFFFVKTFSYKRFDEIYLYSDLATFRTPKLRGPKLKSDEVLDITGKKTCLKKRNLSNSYKVNTIAVFFIILLNPIYLESSLTLSI